MKRKIMISVVLLALIPAVLIGCAVNYYIQSTVKTDKLDSLAGTVHMMSVQLDSFYGRLVYDVERKTETKEVKSMLAAGSSARLSAEDLGRMEGDLKSSIAGTVISGAIIDRSGKIIFSTERGEEGMTLEKTELFRSIVNGDKSSYIGLVTGKDNSDTFEIAVPVKGAQGENMGVLKQNVKLDFLITYLDSISLGDKGYAFLIRDNGYVIDESGNNKVALYNEYQNNSSLEKLVADFKQGRLESGKGVVEFEDDGVVYVGS